LSAEQPAGTTHLTTQELEQLQRVNRKPHYRCETPAKCLQMLVEELLKEPPVRKSYAVQATEQSKEWVSNPPSIDDLSDAVRRI